MCLLTSKHAVLHRFTALSVIYLACLCLGSATEPVMNALAGRETLLICDLPGVQPNATVWFRVAKDHRTLASGTVCADGDGRVTLPVALPEMKPGVALALNVTLRTDSEQGRILRKGGTIWALSEQPLPTGHNPAAPRVTWLYDPAGQTAAAFRSISLPFDTVTRLDALAAMTNATVVVGEGLSLEAERGLWETLMITVARGNRVLLLAPADGRMRPPADWLLLTAGPADRLLRAPSGGGPAYKLDLKAWPLTGAVRIRFRLAGERDQAIFDVGSHAGCEAVRWIDAASGGSFTACGLGIIACWETAPAARWLLAELLNEEK